ncbi:unnamed protein product [Meloidogyne enterolobii]|uniref:Uncharacterized protein n=1 Tax=Meloidogyne enterolobii TaxID=390850 RepID=A0ACB0YVT9_MELEN
MLTRGTDKLRNDKSRNRQVTELNILYFGNSVNCLFLDLSVLRFGIPRIAAILISTLEKKKNIFIREQLNDLTERIAQLEELTEENANQIGGFHDIEANLDELRIVKKKISKVKYLLLAIFIVCLFLLCLFVWIL